MIKPPAIGKIRSNSSDTDNIINSYNVLESQYQNRREDSNRQRKTRKAFTAINGTASFTLGLGTYTFVEKVPYGSSLKPIAPINFEITDTTKMVNLKELLEETGSVIIKDIKNVVGENPPEATFTFTLIQVANAQGDPLENKPIIRMTSKTGLGEFEFDEITGLIPRTYYFKIQETIGGGTGWKNDTSVKIITVIVEFFSRRKKMIN